MEIIKRASLSIMFTFRSHTEDKFPLLEEDATDKSNAPPSSSLLLHPATTRVAGTLYESI